MKKITGIIVIMFLCLLLTFLMVFNHYKSNKDILTKYTSEEKGFSPLAIETYNKTVYESISNIRIQNITTLNRTYLTYMHNTDLNRTWLEENYTVEYYYFNATDFEIITSKNTDCYWYAGNPIRKCVQLIELNIRNNLTYTPGLTNIRIDKKTASNLGNSIIKINGNLITTNIIKNLKNKGKYNITFEFDVPIGISEKFNFSLLDAYIDPEVSGCSSLSGSGIYKLNTSIINSTTSKCFTFNSDNITLDCQGFTIDSNDATSYAIYVNESSQSYKNATIKNCLITDWGSNAIYVVNSNVVNITNVTFNSNPTNCIYFYYSDNMSVTNMNCSEGTSGIDIYSSIITNIQDSVFMNITSALFDLWADGSGDCLGRFYFNNVTDVTENKSIVGYNYPINISNWGNNVSQILLCNAANTNITNLTMVSNNIKKGRAISNVVGMVNIYNSNITNFITVLSMRSSGTKLNVYNSYFRSDYYVTYCDYCYTTNIENTTLIGMDTSLIGTGITHFNYGGSTSVIANSTYINGSIDIFIVGTNTNNITIKNNKFINANQESIYLNYGGSVSKWHKIYNNIFSAKATAVNGNIRCTSAASTPVFMNITYTTGTNIYNSAIGYIAGNFYNTSKDTVGLDSLNCTDADKNGFCDQIINYSIECPLKEIIDYMPISDEFFTTDTTPPTITFISPSDLNVTITTRNYTVPSIQGSETLMNCTVRFNNTNYSMTNTSAILFAYNFTNRNNYNYSYNVTCNDTAGNLGNSSNAWVNILYSAISSTCQCASILAGTPINCAEGCQLDTCNAINITTINAGNITFINNVSCKQLALSANCYLLNLSNNNKLTINATT
jgi:hypothetical protein